MNSEFTLGANRMRRLVLIALIVFIASLTGSAQSSTKRTHNKKMSAQQIHQSAIIIDTHADTTQRFADEDFDLANPPANDDGHISFDKARAGNLGAEFFSIWVEPDRYKGQYVRRALDLIDSVYRQAEKHPDKMMMAYSADDILKAHRSHKLAALMGVEGGHAIDDDLSILRDFYRLGVRYMTLTWSNTNDWADSSGDINDTKVQHHDGLTMFGREVVREMNRLGMMVDISHVADKTFYHALLISRAPVIASHSSARALTNHPRNMTDDMLRALARNGGVCMVNFYSSFISDEYRKAYEAQAPQRNAAVKAAEDEYRRQHPGETVPYAVADRVQKEWAAKIPRPPLSALIDHIDHVAKVAGIDHVGLGSDFDGISSTPQGIDSAADLPKITAELVKRGYSAEDIHKILGGNLLRVFREVEKVSKQIQAEGQQAPLLKNKSATR
jgi:membrane dipeptidase